MHQKEIVKLRKEIAKLEAVRENVPGRMAALEKSLDELQSLADDAVDNAIFVCLKYAGMGRERAKEYAERWVERNIKNKT
ncbi:hypothetical protein ACFLTR_02730 [Chloroflexota bacterium]